MLPGTGIDAQEQGFCIVHQKIHPAIGLNDLLGEPLQIFLFSHIPLEKVVFQQINGADSGPLFCKFLTNAPANALGAAGDHGYFVLKHSYSSIWMATLMTPSSRFSNTS